MTPLVSILVPAYNAAPCIEAALRSASEQTWPRKEIIVVDDGSVDGTYDIARKFGSADVSVVRQENAGAPVARNKAFSMCQGEYIQWLDADDLLAPDKIQRQMERAVEDDSRRILYSCGFGTFYHSPARAQFTPTSLWCDLDPLEWLCRKLGDDHWLQTGTWLASRELTEAAGPWDETLRKDQDGEYACRLAKASSKVCFVPEAKVYYRRSGESSVSYIGTSRDKQDSLFHSMKRCIDHLRSMEDSSRTRAVALRYLESGSLFFHPERPEIMAGMAEMARELGGELAAPRMPAKYDLVQKLLGWRAAKRIQREYNRRKSGVLRFWDKTMMALNGAEGGVR